MSTFMQRLGSMLFFTDPDDALAAEKARNEEARAKLAAARLEHSGEERVFDSQMSRFDQQLKDKRDAYAATAKPMLEEFDDIAISQHYYSEVSSLVKGQESMMEMIRERELGEFGYMSKKLISVSINFEALKKKLTAGQPFAGELSSALADAESADLDMMSAPLRAFAASGVPNATVVRATAFDLARAIEETGKAPVQEPMRGWLDLLKFRTSFSPTTTEQHQARARKTALSFMQHIEMSDYPKALEVADGVSRAVKREKDATHEFFASSYEGFRKTVVPVIASDIFLAYAQSSLDASRFACVEKMLKE